MTVRRDCVLRADLWMSAVCLVWLRLRRLRLARRVLGEQRRDLRDNPVGAALGAVVNGETLGDSAHEAQRERVVATRIDRGKKCTSTISRKPCRSNT